jgi:hypothetical protein
LNSGTAKHLGITVDKLERGALPLPEGKLMKKAQTARKAKQTQKRQIPTWSLQRIATLRKALTLPTCCDCAG